MSGSSAARFVGAAEVAADYYCDPPELANGNDGWDIPYGSMFHASGICWIPSANAPAAGVAYLVSFRNYGGDWGHPQVRTTDPQGRLDMSRPDRMRRNFWIRLAVKSAATYAQISRVKVHPRVRLLAPSDTVSVQFTPGKNMPVLARVYPARARCRGTFDDYGDIYLYPATHYGTYKWLTAVPIPWDWTSNRAVVGFRCWGKGLAVVDEETATYESL